MIYLQFFNPKESVIPFMSAQLAVAVITIQEISGKSAHNTRNLL